ncbi:MAG: hypothetical protein ABI216_19415, partial [Devosia sp.]
MTDPAWSEPVKKSGVESVQLSSEMILAGVVASCPSPGQGFLRRFPRRQGGRSFDHPAYNAKYLRGRHARGRR